MNINIELLGLNVKLLKLLKLLKSSRSWLHPGFLACLLTEHLHNFLISSCLMLTRFLRRSYSLESVYDPLRSSIDRNIYRNVLNLSQERISGELLSELRHNRISGLSKRIRVNSFLQALFTNDFANAIKFVQSIRSQALRHANDSEYKQIYMTCLLSLVTYLAQDYSKEIRPKDLNEITSTIVKTPKSIASCYTDQVTEIKGLTLVVVLKSLKETRSAQKMNYIGLVTQARLLAQKFDYGPKALLDLIVKLQIDVVGQFNEVFSNDKAVSLGIDKIHPHTSIDKYKNGNGSMSFDGLCHFIREESYNVEKWTNVTNCKLYNIYEDLDGEEKNKFMTEYMEFNKQKQLMIESQCLNLYKSTSMQKQMNGFTAVHNKWMVNWISVFSDAIESLLLCNRSMQRFSFIVKYMKSEVLASMCLAYMMSSTIPVAHVKVLELCKRLAYGVKSELMKAKAYSSSTITYHHDEDFILFFCEVIKIAVQKCQLPEDAQFPEFNLSEESFGRQLFKHDYAKDVASESKFKYYGVISVHPFISESFKSYQDLLRAGSYLIPMIYPPRPWTSPTEGGFLSFPIKLVKSAEPESFDLIMKMAHRTGQLESVYRSLNALGSTKWAVNPFTLEAFKEALAKDHLKKLVVPSTAKAQNTIDNLSKEYEVMLSDSSTPNFRLQKKRASINQIKKDQANLNIYYKLILALAESFSKNGEVLYLPHNLDFRGRVYPSISFLSHHSEDLVRSLLMFWEAKELGPTGFDWLMYQLSSMYNKGKLSMQELKDFVLANKENIVDSAQNPFDGDMWWASGDSPWQSLALCKEILSVWNFRGDVSKYKSRIPIHQDGTCNGLQHYAALSADKKAAESVNVLPTEKRQDIYSTILSLVKERVLKDQQLGRNTDLADLAYPILERKLIKQTVMTTVYGVTLYGATKQIKNQIEDVLLAAQHHLKSETLKKESSKVSSYIAIHVLLCINELFSGAKLIQSWLVENCTRCIQTFLIRSTDETIDFFSKHHYQPFMWTSLSGFPVVQYYRKSFKKTILSSLQSIALNDYTKIAPIDERKQKNGVAPNFIHSIDAMHLLMTCLAAHEEGITFAAIHDCFWTHASEVTKLSSIIRDEFIRLHYSDVMENLRNDLLHANESNFQLVWVSTDIDKEFCNELISLRKEYTKLAGSITRRWNEALNHEIKTPDMILNLIKSYQPELLLTSSASGDPIIYESFSYVRRKSTKVSKKTHIPVLVPVKILDLPKMGALDIKSVRDSIHFFS